MKYFVLFFTVFFIPKVDGQVYFNSGVELGYAFTNRDIKEKMMSGGTNTTHYNSNPVVGGFTDFTFWRFIHLGVGLNYQQEKESYQLSKDYQNLIEAWHMDYKEEKKFQKLCLPLSAGLTFRIKNWRAIIFGGLRINWLFSGKHSESANYDYYTSTPDLYNERVFNPAKVNPKKMIFNQRLFGISLIYKEKFKFSASTNTGFIFYSDNSLGCLGYSMKNNDYIISLGYLFPNNRRLCSGYLRKSKSVRYL